MDDHQDDEEEIRFNRRDQQSSQKGPPWGGGREGRQAKEGKGRNWARFWLWPLSPLTPPVGDFVDARWVVSGFKSTGTSLSLPSQRSLLMRIDDAWHNDEELTPTRMSLHPRSSATE